MQSEAQPSVEQTQRKLNYRIFLTENERVSDRYPLYTGAIDIDGNKYEVALWRGQKPSRDGKPYLSGTLTPVIRPKF